MESAAWLQFQSPRLLFGLSFGGHSVMAPFILLLLMLQLLLISFLPIVPNAQEIRQINISLGSSLSSSDGASWPSPSGHFAFGFYPKSGGLAVGVWLATGAERTIVWTANRDDPPITGGYVRLNFDGRLLWFAPGGTERAISQGSEPAAFATMADTGNFALYSSKGAIVWATFDHPTDTLLPGQSLLPDHQLVSSLSETDRTTGMFALSNQNDGNLVLYPEGTTQTADDSYWSTATFQLGFQLTLKFDTAGLLYLSGDDGNYTKDIARPNSSSSSQSSPHEVYYRATIDADGILRLYSHSLSDSGKWTARVEWAALDNKCLVHGVCPPNSYCSLTSSMEPNCLCPPGFRLIDSHHDSTCMPVNPRGGACTATDSTDGGWRMVSMTNTTWVDKPYHSQPTTSVEECGAMCLDDCVCEMVLFRDNTCRKQQLPLGYGRNGGGDTLLVKVATATAEPTTCGEIESTYDHAAYRVCIGIIN